MKKIILFSLLSIASFNLFAQKQVTLTIRHLLGSNPFAFTTASQNDLAHNFKISRVDYYISGIKIIHDGGTITNVPNHYILAKGDNNVIDLLGTFNVTNVEGIKFSIGVEAPVNNDDPTLWLAPHPLSPQSPSMHWGWSAGYRFIALEGMAGPTLNTGFEMHGLWNANYFEQTVMAAGVNTGSNVTINLDADYIQALKGINLNAGPIDHGANATDLTVLENFRDYVFKAGAGIPSSVGLHNQNVKIDVYPNPGQGKFYISFDQQQVAVSSAKVYDALGNIARDIDLNATNTFDLSGFSKGFYVVKFYNNDVNVANRKLLLD